VHLQQRLLPLP
jgi:hypothetical protein